MFFKLP